MSFQFKRIAAAVAQLLKIDRRLDEIKFNQGLILSDLRRARQSTNLHEHEFKVFSQWGEDGILQHLVGRIRVPNRTFIEFGVEDFFESNCRFLMMKDLWQGFIIDGSEENLQRLRSSDLYWRHQLQARCAFITRENVAALLDESGFAKEVGILSVDVDGVDWFLLNELSQWRAAIVVVEYNGLFGKTHPVSVPYDAGFHRTRAHPSNVYYGASLAAFDSLLRKRGYGLVGVNGMGSNAFFVRRDLLPPDLPEFTVEQCFRPTWFREGRDGDGKLTLKSNLAMAREMAHLPLVNTESGAALRLGDVIGDAGKPS